MIAGLGAILLGLVPKFCAILSATPVGALGGAGTALFGIIGILGARIWIYSKVNFADPINLLVSASALVIGISDMSWSVGKYTFSGIINATLVAVLGTLILNALRKSRG